MKKVIAVVLLLVVCAGFTFAAETARDGRFIAYSNGTVLDTSTNLMWANRDNGFTILWSDAMNYCQKYRGGGYTDWRMPTQDELAGLSDPTNTYLSDSGFPVHITGLIRITSANPWASDSYDSKAAYFDFSISKRGWFNQTWNGNGSVRALPVRSVN